VLQPAVRRILWNALKRDRTALASFAQGARLGVPVGLAVRTSAPVVAAANRMNRADDDAVRRDLAALPGWLRRVDDWIEEGVLGSQRAADGERLRNQPRHRSGTGAAGFEAPGAADLQIGASLRLAMTLDDLRPHIAERPAGELALRAIPEFPGQAPPVLPEAWLGPLREARQATAS
jgi:glutathione S-transferase